MAIDHESGMTGKKPANPFFLIPLPIIAVYLVVMFVKMFHIVGAGDIGIRTRLGALDSEPLPEGLHIINPFFDTIYHMNIKIQDVRADCHASSGDLQQVDAAVSLQYYVVDALAPKLYQQVGKREDMKTVIITPAMQEGVKAVTSTFTADELITQRELVKIDIREAIMSFIDNTLEAKSLVQSIRIANVAITNFSFSAMFNEAIEAKVEAEQLALQAENEKLTTITNAQADASEKMLQAEALAFQINATAIARAQAIESEAAALEDNPELITLRKIERWNGKLPTYESSNDNDTFSGQLNNVDSD